MKVVKYDGDLPTLTGDERMVGEQRSMRVLKYSRLLAPADETVILLVRHGASQEDLDNKFCGWCDSPMVDLGHEQMQKVAGWLQNSEFKIGNVYTDDLERTDESAAYIEPLALGRQIILPQFRAWGLGPEFAGKVKTPELEAKRKFYVKNPDLLPTGPESETLNHNKAGWMSAFTYVVSKSMPGVTDVIVVHSNGPKILSPIYQNQKLKLGHGGIMAVRIRQDGVVIDTLLQGWVENEILDGGEGMDPVAAITGEDIGASTSQAG